MDTNRSSDTQPSNVLGRNEAVTDIVRYLNNQFQKAVERGEETETLHDFLDFARRHLDHIRPVEQFAADRNVGVRLSDNAWVTISPSTGSEGQGDMQDSPYVPISGR